MKGKKKESMVGKGERKVGDQREGRDNEQSLGLLLIIIIPA